MASKKPEQQETQDVRRANGLASEPPESESADAKGGDAASGRSMRRSTRIRRPRPGGIRGRLFLLIALALGPVLVLQAWVYYQRYVMRRDEAMRTEVEVAQGVATTFTGYLNDVRRQLNTVGQAIVAFVLHTDVEIVSLLGTITEQHPTILSVSWVDPQGVVVASSLPSAIGYNVLGRTYFQQILAGQSWALGDLMPQGAGTLTPTFAIAVAVHDGRGALSGVAVAAIEPTRLGEQTFAAERLAQGAYAIFDRQGRLVYRSPETSLTWEQRNRWRQTEPLLQQALAGHIAQGAITSAVAGDRRLAARVPIPGVDWVAGASRPARVALGPVRLALIREAGVGLLVTLFAFLAAYVIAWTIADPLRRLEADAKAIGAGRMEPPAELEGPREVRSLRNTMAEMAADLRRRTERLRRSEERFRKLFEADLIGVYVTRPDGRFLDCNEKMVKMLGYESREEVLRLRSTDLYVDPAFRAEAVRTLLRDGIFPGREGLVRRKDGTVIHALGFAVLLRDEQTGEPYIQGVAVDITDRRQTEEALRELATTLESRVAQRTAELEQRAGQLQKLALELSQAEDRERKRLAEILHDDLQQQLAAAKFHLGLLSNQVKDDASLREAVALVEALLKDAIAKSRSLSHELSPAALYHGDFGEAIEWLANQVHMKHGLAVRVDIHGPLEVSSDAIKAFLFRATREILFNVVKHANVAEATVRLRRRRQRVWLAVRDKGRGFDPKTLGQVGGFGLTSIRERVELIGGRMKIRSAPGRGSTFLIAVPDSQATVETGPGPGPGNRRGLPLRVLLADDHKVVREGLATLLNEQQDIEVVGQAANGREAVSLAHDLKPDVVVMDVSMPLMEGDEATQRIKEDKPDTRVIGLSMFEEPGLVERMRKAGADRYLIKTAPAEQLLAAIREERPEA